MRAFKARYSADCSRCGQRIQAGQMIYQGLTAGQPWYAHKTCQAPVEERDAGQLDLVPEAPRFDGDDYQPGRDDVRLTGQLLRIVDVMKDREWHTLEDISQRTNDPITSISAQLRHLRKPRFGGHLLITEYVGNGLYRYRVVFKEKARQ